jgi:transcription elongation factor Elf1
MEKGTCPVCSGHGRVKATSTYKHVMAGYDKESDTLPCQNCGGQYQWGRPSGEVNMDYSGQPCVHHYSGKNVGRCLTEYTCNHCGDRYQIDSGD